MEALHWTRQFSVPVIATMLISSCTAPHHTFDASAQASGLTQTQITTSLFSHKMFSNNRPVTKEMHVYFAGDGTPWLYGKLPSQDPTPKNSVALKLMGKDNNAAVLLGRPCYHGLHAQPECSENLWTNGRYSQPVVQSMYLALIDLMKGTPAKTSLVLIGYSGGATLASLVAHFDQPDNKLNISKVISVAGNQDINAWCDYHNVPRLTDSLDPMKQPRLPGKIKLLFLAGQKDNIVLPEHSQTYAQQQLSSRFAVVEDFDHTCCWEGVWKEVLYKANSDKHKIEGRIALK